MKEATRERVCFQNEYLPPVLLGAHVPDQTASAITADTSAVCCHSTIKDSDFITQMRIGQMGLLL